MNSRLGGSDYGHMEGWVSLVLSAFLLLALPGCATSRTSPPASDSDRLNQLIVEEAKLREQIDTQNTQLRTENQQLKTQVSQLQQHPTDQPTANSSPSKIEVVDLNAKSQASTMSAEETAMAAAVDQINAATLLFSNAMADVKQHWIREFLINKTTDTLKNYKIRLDYVDLSGCPDEFKAAVQDYSRALQRGIEVDVESSSGNSSIHEIDQAWQNVDLAATKLDVICTKHNIHFIDINQIDLK